jgi:hypothetical protein
MLFLLIRQLWESWLKVFEPSFPWWNRLPGSSGFSKVVPPVAGLWTVVGPFCPQGKLQLGFLITHFSAHYQILQGGQICCWFHQVAAPPSLSLWQLSVMPCLQQAKTAQCWSLLPLLEVNSLFFPTLLPGRGELCSLFMVTSFVQKVCNLPTSCAGLCGSLEAGWSVMLSWHDCRFTLVQLG